MAKRIIIVGGGYVGVQLAKALDGKADVTLVEPRSHFVTCPCDDPRGCRSASSGSGIDPL